MTTQARSTRTTSNGNYHGNQPNARRAGVHLSPNWNDHFRMPQPWGNYQPPSVAPYPDDDDCPMSRQRSFESLPFTNASQQPQNSPKRSLSPERGRNPTSQRGRSVSNTNIPIQSQSQLSQSGHTSPDHYRSQSASFLSIRSMSPESSPGHPPSRTNSPHLHPSHSPYSLDVTQLAETNQKTNPIPSGKPAPPQD